MGRSTRSTTRRCTLAFEGLEDRALLSGSTLFRPNSSFFGSSSSSYFKSVALHAYDVYVSDLQGVELNSLATPAQFQALRDDARSISESASQPGATGTLANRQVGAIAATLILDRSLLQGRLSDQGWSVVKSRFSLDLAGSHVPPSLIDKTVSDMKSAAVSAGVDPGTSQVLANDLTSYQSARNQAGPGGGFHDPQVYYTQHLRGFFRGWAVQKTTDTATLQTDVGTITTGLPVSGSSVVHRDVAALQSLGGSHPSDTFAVLTSEYLATFVNGSPSANALATFQSSVSATLGGSATSSRTASINRLSQDAPAFYSAVGSEANVSKLVGDVTAVVNDGQGSPLNPFRIVIRP